ncbi:MAG: translocation/assembly module TamB domain-containing protein [Tenuifilaceae bacterium]|nr:translocation/assembly module TamB domain-containing protein [Tenuifilaceae bacterium]
MVKVIKKSVKIFLVVVVVLLFVPTTIWIAIQNSKVQTWLVNKTTDILEQKLNTKVHIGKFDFRPFNRVVLRDVYVEDLNKDTLVFAKSISASLIGFNRSKNALNLYRVTLDNAYVNFVTDSLGSLNITGFINLLVPPADTIQSSDGGMALNVRNIRLEKSTYRMFSEKTKANVDFGINFDNLLISEMDLDIKNLSITGDTISFVINEFSGADRSGFVVDRFRVEMSFSSKHMDFSKLRIQAMGSKIAVPFLKMSYTGWKDLSSFLQNVELNGEIDNSLLTTTFLSFFVPDVQRFNEKVNLEAKFRGTISDFRVRDLKLNTARSTQILANANLTGLPDINNTFIFTDIKQLTTTIRDIESVKDTRTGQTLVSVPRNFESLKTINFTGNFTGFISDFVAYGTLATAIGSTSIDLSFKPDQNAKTLFNGKVATQELDIGALIGDDLLGKISLTASIEGSTDYDKHLEAHTETTIYSFEALNYKYRNLNISGVLNNRNFVGSLFLDDPNAKLNFMGKLDFSDTIPVFDFSAFVPKLDLVKLNLNTSDSISQASFLFTAKFSGNNLDNTKGEIKVVNGFYKNQNGEIKTSDIVITANNTADSKQIALKSEFAEGELRGKYNYASIFGSLQKMIYLYIPALSHNNTKPEVQPSGVENPEYNDYIIRLRLRNTRKLTNVLFPSFRIAENTNVFGIYNPDFQTLNLKVKIPEVVFAGNTIKDISIDGVTNESKFTASITTPLVEASGAIIRNVAINAVAENNQLATSIIWDNKSSLKNTGEIIANTEFVHRPGNNQINIAFEESQFVLNDTTWNVSPSQIQIDSALVHIKDFMLFNKQQSLKVEGKIASSSDDYIRVDLANIDVSNLNLYTKDLGYQFSGEIDGYAKVTHITENPLFFADLSVNGLNANSYLVGDISLNSQWYAEEKKLSVDIINTLGEEQALSVVGDFFPENQSLRFLARINDLAIGLVEPFLEGNVRDLKGSIGGSVNITGTASKPLLNGILRLKEAGGLIDFTRTRYSMSDPITLENSNIIFRNFKIYDSNNRLATLNGAVNTDYFKNITLDLNITPSNFQFLNTTERDNELFYGTVYASGQARVTGNPNDILVTASVKTEQRTALFLPLSTSTDVAEHDFVNFISRSDEIIIIEEFFGLDDVVKSNVRVNLDLEVTPDADVQIIIDKQLGDIIRANGSGNLKLEIDLNQDVFNMFGQFMIEKGDYLFTLQGVINKRFQIGDGSTITWNGQIDEALMDIRAIYNLRTSLKPLNPSSDDPIFNNRTPVDCKINLSGKLMEPTIGFDIVVPIAESDPSIKAVVQDALSTEERVSKQFLSLLVINSFTSDDPSSQGAGVGQGLASTAGEMLSNQLSNWISQWTSAVDIGVNWRPGDEISSNEIELALSTQLFNDRVTINSNVDMGNQSVSSGIAGDFSVDVKIVPSGKLRVKAFARSNDEMINGVNSGDYTTGAGLMYREDFNSFRELLNRYKKVFTRRKEPEVEFDFSEPDGGANANPANSSIDEESQIGFVEIKAL